MNNIVISLDADIIPGKSIGGIPLGNNADDFSRVKGLEGKKNYSTNSLKNIT
ncbi:hypothetical protein [Xylocopilactobacillus apicola]|uniref:Uncharacterized protein n=1 Tax=Xylocopilactobacillus apicola TaxID=2932184 RepID=A0AAU9D1S5_9LACO|nr:hypothetical protein [Xylocopilactobacillus apicola]BDR57654.1 hypothetical protein XA3_00950 [Xylocopilactobacillus apicola]